MDTIDTSNTNKPNISKIPKLSSQRSINNNNSSSITSTILTTSPKPSRSKNRIFEAGRLSPTCDFLSNFKDKLKKDVDEEKKKKGKKIGIVNSFLKKKASTSSGNTPDHTVSGIVSSILDTLKDVSENLTPVEANIESISVQKHLFMSQQFIVSHLKENNKGSKQVIVDDALLRQLAELQNLLKDTITKLEDKSTYTPDEDVRKIESNPNENIWKANKLSKISKLKSKKIAPALPEPQVDVGHETNEHLLAERLKKLLETLNSPYIQTMYHKKQPTEDIRKEVNDEEGDRNKLKLEDLCAKSSRIPKDYVYPRYPPEPMTSPDYSDEDFPADYKSCFCEDEKPIEDSEEPKEDVSSPQPELTPSEHPSVTTIEHNEPEIVRKEEKPLEAAPKLEPHEQTELEPEPKVVQKEEPPLDPIIPPPIPFSEPAESEWSNEESPGEDTEPEKPKEETKAAPQCHAPCSPAKCKKLKKKKAEKSKTSKNDKKKKETPKKGDEATSRSPPNKKPLYESNVTVQISTPITSLSRVSSGRSSLKLREQDVRKKPPSASGTFEVGLGKGEDLKNPPPSFDYDSYVGVEPATEESLSILNPPNKSDVLKSSAISTANKKKEPHFVDQPEFGVKNTIDVNHVQEKVIRRNSTVRFEENYVQVAPIMTEIAVSKLSTPTTLSFLTTKSGTEETSLLDTGIQGSQLMTRNVSIQESFLNKLKGCSSKAIGGSNSILTTDVHRATSSSFLRFFNYSVQVETSLGGPYNQTQDTASTSPGKSLENILTTSTSATASPDERNTSTSTKSMKRRQVERGTHTASRDPPSEASTATIQTPTRTTGSGEDYPVVQVSRGSETTDTDHRRKLSFSNGDLARMTCRDCMCQIGGPSVEKSGVDRSAETNEADYKLEELDFLDEHSPKKYYQQIIRDMEMMKSCIEMNKENKSSARGKMASYLDDGRPFKSKHPHFHTTVDGVPVIFIWKACPEDFCKQNNICPNSGKRIRRVLSKAMGGSRKYFPSGKANVDKKKSNYKSKGMWDHLATTISSKCKPQAKKCPDEYKCRMCEFEDLLKKEPGDKEPGDKEPGDKEPVIKKPVKRQPLKREPFKKEPGSKDPKGNETSSSSSPKTSPSCQRRRCLGCDVIDDPMPPKSTYPWHPKNHQKGTVAGCQCEYHLYNSRSARKFERRPKMKSFPKLSRKISSWSTSSENEEDDLNEWRKNQATNYPSKMETKSIQTYYLTPRNPDNPPPLPLSKKGNNLEGEASDNELPYLIGANSLPQFEHPDTVCSSKLFDVKEVSCQLRDEIKTGNSKVKERLLRVNLNALLDSFRPAKCCKKMVLNGRTRSNFPYPASLQSLPLSEEDLDRILDIIQSNWNQSFKWVNENEFNFQTENRRPVPTKRFWILYNLHQKIWNTLQFYLNLETTFHAKTFNSHHEVYFFELFKKPEERKQINSTTTTTTTTPTTTTNTTNSGESSSTDVPHSTGIRHDLRIFEFIRKIYASRTTSSNREKRIASANRKKDSTKTLYRHTSRKHVRKRKKLRRRNDSKLTIKQQTTATSTKSRAITEKTGSKSEVSTKVSSKVSTKVSSKVSSKISSKISIARSKSSNSSIATSKPRANISFLLIPTSELNNYFCGELSSMYSPSLNSLPFEESENQIGSPRRVSRERMGENRSSNNYDLGKIKEELEEEYENDLPVKEVPRSQSEYNTTSSTSYNTQPRRWHHNLESMLAYKFTATNNSRDILEEFRTPTDLETISTISSFDRSSRQSLDSNDINLRKKFFSNIPIITEKSSSKIPIKTQKEEYKPNLDKIMEKSSETNTTLSSNLPIKKIRKFPRELRTLSSKKSDAIKLEKQTSTGESLGNSNKNDLDTTPISLNFDTLVAKRQMNMQIDKAVVAYAISPSVEFTFLSEDGIKMRDFSAKLNTFNANRSENICVWPVFQNRCTKKKNSAFVVAIHSSAVRIGSNQNNPSGDQYDHFCEICNKKHVLSTDNFMLGYIGGALEPTKKSRSKQQSNTHKRDKEKTNKDHEEKAIPRKDSGKSRRKPSNHGDSVSTLKKKRKSLSNRQIIPEVIDIKVPTTLKTTRLKHKYCNGNDRPGYVAVLSTPCNCPDVTIFIPCYCGKNSKPKNSGGKIKDESDYAMVPIIERKDDEKKK